ncbi:CIC11C00000005818 [Sungouiella intermedia]|uniref:Serine/threonine-protein phosphatase 2A activator n=1 Tax=Sungouiella intermedia TaxID=45354 RepID=A0A1L0DCH2_9ASCO|nr:CIC11C00000005818 [[Candida] intermedia]
MKPTKRIVLKTDLEIWTNSETYLSLLDFVIALQTSVAGQSNNVEVPVSPVVNHVLNALSRVSEIIAENPVVHEKDISRFGKVEFRDFYDQVSAEGPGLMAKLLNGENDKYCEELSCYFGESWGDRQRIDYGSGHELNFLCFLYGLNKTGAVGPDDYKALILKVFNTYIGVMRQLQKTYWLEPAGSHGVWGLDDYHFLPFLFGAAQLATHPHMKPKLIHNKELVETYWKQYMYLECIHFINSIKTVPGNHGSQVSLRWHSPMLDDILSAKSWSKIQEGMIKMYKAEVLGKLPIIQHMMFGELIPVPPDIPEHSEEEVDECGHIHDDTLNTWGDCCGIKIPSAIAASQSLEANTRPIPFD